MLNLPSRFIAHRGASAFAPENTLVAIRKAKELGAHWIEFDVMLTTDNEAIVIHDLTLERTTNGRGKIAEFAYKDIAQLDAGSWFAPTFIGEKIPTFKEVLALAAELKLGINVEIKPAPGFEMQTAAVVFKLLAEEWLPKKLPLLVSSAVSQSIATVRDYDNEIALGFIVDQWLPNWQDILIQLNCLSLHIHHQVLTPTNVAAVRKLGKHIFAFTVNDIGRAQQLFSWGVDGVFSDLIFNQ